MRRWWRPRRRLAGWALATALLTGAACVVLGGSGGHRYGVGVYLAATVASLFVPAAVAVQLLVGLLLAGSLVVGQGTVGALAAVPVVAGLVAVSELLAAVARLDLPFERQAGDALLRAGAMAVGTAGVFATVLAAGELPGPVGFVGIVTASVACAVLGIWLAERAG